MTDKVRRIDFSPDEYISGVNGMTAAEQGVYWMVCALIYSRGEPIANDARWIGRAAGCRKSSDCRAILDGLIARGKLSVDDDGALQNGRTMRELGRALGRVEKARESGRRGGRPRHANGTPTARQRHPNGTPDDPVAADINGLAKAQPSTINHQPSKKESETLASARVRARAHKGPSKAINGGQQDDERQRLPSDWIAAPDQVEFARSLGLDPEAVADAFRLWWTEGKGQREQRSAKGWAATWRGWCRRDAERGGSRPTTGNLPGNRHARGGGLVGAALRLGARDRDK